MTTRSLLVRNKESLRMKQTRKQYEDDLAETEKRELLEQEARIAAEAAGREEWLQDLLDIKLKQKHLDDKVIAAAECLKIMRLNETEEIKETTFSDQIHSMEKIKESLAIFPNSVYWNRQAADAHLRSYLWNVDCNWR